MDFNEFFNGNIALKGKAVNDIVITIPNIKKAYSFKIKEYSGIKIPNNNEKTNKKFLSENIFFITVCYF